MLKKEQVVILPCTHLCPLANYRQIQSDFT